MTTQQAPATAAIPATQLTATAVTNLAVPVSGLAVQIAASARAGNSRFEIRLDPAELGRIDVRLDVDRHGNVTSHLTVEKPETLAMLRQDAPQLQRSLEDAGLKTGQSGLQFSLRDQSSGQQNNNNGQTERQPQRLVISETAAAPLVAANATYSYAAGANRGLDIRV
ncbi:MAG: flagellar hook-length control protein FliK [Xanthobacteraceae bacterium]